MRQCTQIIWRASEKAKTANSDAQTVNLGFLGLLGLARKA
jgi:hypothetical protein